MDITAGTTVAIAVEIPVTAIAFNNINGFIVAAKTGIYKSNSDFSNTEFLCDPEKNKTDVCINDAVVCPKGHLWFGTMNDNELEKPDGSIYILQKNVGSLIKFDTGFSVANGIAFSPDHSKVYISNMFQSIIYCY